MHTPVFWKTVMHKNSSHPFVYASVGIPYDGRKRYKKNSNYFTRFRYFFPIFKTGNTHLFTMIKVLRKNFSCTCMLGRRQTHEYVCPYMCLALWSSPSFPDCSLLKKNLLWNLELCHLTSLASPLVPDITTSACHPETTGGLHTWDLRGFRARSFCSSFLLNRLIPPLQP